MTKLSFNLPDHSAEAIRAIAQQRGCSMTQAIAAAIRTEALISGHMRRGGKVLMQDKDGSVKQLVLAVC